MKKHYKKSLLLILFLLVLFFAHRVISIENDMREIKKFKLNERIFQEIEMLTTAYSKKDSCHYPKGDKCLTASGTIAKEGIAACPRNWPFGKKFYLDGREYTCQDRYASYLSPRLDIWVENDAADWGAQKKIIKL